MSSMGSSDPPDGDRGVLSLLDPLIRTDTRNPGGNEPALARLLATELARHDPDELKLVQVPRLDGRLLGAYVYARWGTPHVLVNAHLDTVPPSDGWSADPYEPRLHDDRLIGLGAADDKGAIAAVLAALGASRPANAGVLFSGDEECGGTCMGAFLAQERLESIRRAVVCEPTGCRVGVRHRGMVAMGARVRGTGGHSSRADELPSPIAELAMIAVQLHAWGVDRRREGPPGMMGMCLNLARLDGGVAFNVIAEHATLVFSFRPPPGASLATLRDEITALATGAVPHVELDVDLEKSPFSTQGIEDFRPLLGNAVDAPADLHYWTEAALLAEAGIDSVVFGPGDVAQAHAPDEWVSLSHLEKAKEAFTRLFNATR